MAVGKFDARQTISRDALAQLINGVNTGGELDDLLREINDQLRSPLNMSATAPTSDLVVNIGSIITTSSETSRNKTIPTISNTLPTFASGTVTFPADANGGLDITVSIGTGITGFTVTQGNFIKVGINLDATGALSLTTGTEGASLAAATAPPAVNNTFAIGYIAIESETGTGTIRGAVSGVNGKIENSDLFQYAGGGGGSGTGDANSFLETLKNFLNDSTYEALDPNIFSQDGQTKISAFGGTAAFSLVTQTADFLAAADSVTSIQHLDDEFRGSNLDVSKIQAAFKWLTGSVDASATYEVSRDGGAHFQSFSVDPVWDTANGGNTFAGSHIFTTEQDALVFAGYAIDDDQTELTDAAGTEEALGQKFTLPTDTTVTSITMTVSEVGSPVGNFTMNLRNDDSGLPSTTSSPIATASFDATTISGTTVVTLTVPNELLVAGDYHVTIETDAAYKAGFTASTDAIRVHGDFNGNNGTPGADGSRFDAGAWIALSPGGFIHDVIGTTENFGTSQFDATGATGTVEELQGAGAVEAVAEQFAITNPFVIRRITVSIEKNNSPVGNFFVQIIRDNAGVPSTDEADIMVTSALQSVDDLSAGTNNDFVIDIPATALDGSSDYHVVIKTDAAYKAGFTTGGGGNNIGIFPSDVTPTASIIRYDRFSAGSWINGATDFPLDLQVFGRVLDLRVRITASVASKLEGYGILYDEQSSGISTGDQKLEKFIFNSVTDNDNEFTLTKFVPDPDLLNVYYAEAGQVFRHPAFSIDGQKIIFAANTFNNGGVSSTVTLLFDQTRGGSFDTSDRNVQILATNYLGSLDANFDLSSAGRGIKLRRPDGTLREISLDNADNIVVSSLP